MWQPSSATGCGDNVASNFAGCPAVQNVPVASLTQKLAELQILDALNRLPDSAALTPDEAAVMLRLSPSTLERMRRDDSGPAYVQGGGRGAKGTNQKCAYVKADLLGWQQENRVSNSMAAAMRRGQAYMPYVDPTPKRSFFDLVTKRAFYIDSNGLVAGALDDTEIDVFISRLGRWRIDWLNPIAAAGRVWSDRDGFKEYAEGVKVALGRALEGVAKTLE